MVYPDSIVAYIINIATRYFISLSVLSEAINHDITAFYHTLPLCKYAYNLMYIDISICLLNLFFRFAVYELRLLSSQIRIYFLAGRNKNVEIYSATRYLKF